MTETMTDPHEVRWQVGKAYLLGILAGAAIKELTTMFDAMSASERQQFTAEVLTAWASRGPTARPRRQ
jgi:hypothetical protein